MAGASEEGWPDASGSVLAKRGGSVDFGSSKVEDLDDVDRESVSQASEIVAEMKDIADANVLYQKCFQLLKLGGLEAEIPRLVVFGQQSMGKTTLLDFIMGGPIGYSSTDTGTRQPVVIMLKPSSSGEIECAMDGKPLSVKDLQDAMRDVMSSSNTISSEELELEIAVPKGVHAIFVDLPGIKDDSKSGAELTRNVVRTYVKNNPNDLYLLVKKSSDDPANWPWSLREFILSPPPRGLGLTPRQTIAVGTRARDFLLGERNDVKTQGQLLDRVRKRAVKDASGGALPLFLLELFSLSLEEKENLDFVEKKNAMHNQITSGRNAIFELLQSGFQPAGAVVRNTLFNYFDVNVFKKELNNKFHHLLSDQLGILERRLHRKSLETQKTRRELETQLIEQNPQSIREYMKLFMREFTQVVTELVTGNYMIIRLPESGDTFLNRFGGNLTDNLEDGHELAMELFPETEHYDPDFLTKIMKHAEDVFKKEDETRENARPDLPVRVTGPVSAPQPDVRGVMQAGQYVRYILSKDSAQMYGYVVDTNERQTQQPEQKKSEDEPKDSKTGKDGKTTTKGDKNNPPASSEKKGVGSSSSTSKTHGGAPSAVTVAFFFHKQQPNVLREGPPNRAVPNVESTQKRDVERSRLTVIFPVTMMVTHTSQPPPGFRCWRSVVRSDDWIGLEPVSIVAIGPLGGPQHHQAQLEKQAAQVAAGQQPPPGSDPANQLSASSEPLTPEQLDKTQVTVSPVLGGKLDGAVDARAHDEVLLLSELYMESPDRTGDREGEWERLKLLSPLQRISGEFAETKLLNQLALTHLGRWLKFHIVNLEPDRRFSNDVLLQLMRSVRHVIDKADWEPLVADLLQANVRGGLVHLSRLASCATAVAIRRILRAAMVEVRRQIRVGDLTSGLVFLANNERFMEELESALEEYVRERARVCGITMRDLIFEQTHAIHFEMIEDFFEGCKQFETDFLGGGAMDDVTRRVKEGLSSRKQRLGVADIYARQSPLGGISHEMIYEEVRIQFWVVKMLLAAPLTTKLYMHFIKDIKDKSQHLASESKFVITSESQMERRLQEQLLCEPSTESNRPLPRSDDQLIQHFGFALNKDEIGHRISATKRVDEFVKLALEGVERLRQQMQKKGGVDFLMRLDLGGQETPTASLKAAAAGKQQPPPSATSTAFGAAAVPRSPLSGSGVSTFGTASAAAPGGGAAVDASSTSALWQAATGGGVKGATMSASPSNESRFPPTAAGVANAAKTASDRHHSVATAPSSGGGKPATATPSSVTGGGDGGAVSPGARGNSRERSTTTGSVSHAGTTRGASSTSGKK